MFMLSILAQSGWWEPLVSPVAQRIILVGAVTNVACALVGCYLVLRRMSYIGHGLAHAIFGGAVLSYGGLFSGFNPPPAQVRKHHRELIAALCVAVPARA